MPIRREQIEELSKGFQAIRRKLMEGFMQKDALDLPPSQWLVLKAIDQSPSVGIKEIAQALSISSSAVTQTVNALQKKGLIKRAHDSRDRRNVRITLTPKTVKKMASMRKKAVDRMAPWFNVLTEKEFLQYLAATKKIAENLSHSSHPADAKQ